MGVNIDTPQTEEAIMKCRFTVANPAGVIVALTLIGAPLAASSPSWHAVAVGAEVDACVEAAMAHWNVPGMAVAVVMDHQLVYEQGYGRYREAFRAFHAAHRGDTAGS